MLRRSRHCRRRLSSLPFELLSSNHFGVAVRMRMRITPRCNDMIMYKCVQRLLQRENGCSTIMQILIIFNEIPLGDTSLPYLLCSRIGLEVCRLMTGRITGLTSLAGFCAVIGGFTPWISLLLYSSSATV